MKIAFVYFHGLGPGGYPKDLRWLAGSLARQGHAVSLVSREGDQRDGLAEGVETVLPQSLAEVTRDVDVVHLWGLMLPEQVRAVWSVHRKVKAAPVVISPLAELMPLHRARAAWKKTPYLVALRPLLRTMVDGMHLFSREEYWSAVRYIRPRTSFEAGLGIFPIEYRPMPSTVGDYLLFFGRNDVAHKGLDVLVEGFRLARRQGLELPLVVAGRAEGSSVEFWERVMQDPELAPAVEVVGEVGDKRGAQLLADARCLVFPSRWDGPPRPVREAIALGTPAIVTNGTNMAEVIEGSGAGMAVALEPSSLAAGLQAAASDDTVVRWRKGVRDLQHVLSWDNVALAYLKGYEGTLSV